ncbi:Hypothetical protein NocV09_07000200 [Nannochloropsis oceanica]
MTTRPQLISRGGNLAFLLLHVAALAFLGVGANAFHLTPRISATADTTSFLITRAMRLPGLSSPRKSIKTLMWIFPPFLRNLGMGGTRLRRSSGSRSSRSSSGSNGKPRLNASPLSYDSGPTFLHRTESSSPESEQQASPPQSSTSEGSSSSYSYGEGNGDVVPILIKYTGGVGYKSLYTGVCRVLKERFGNITIRKTILGVTEIRGGKKLGVFEVVVGDRSFTSKPGAPGVYLPMADIQAAIERLVVRREKENRILAAAAAAAAALVSEGNDGVAYQESIHP